MRSLYASVHFLRLYPCLNQKFLSHPSKELSNFYSTSWPSLRITKPTRKVSSLYFINPPTANHSVKTSHLSDEEIQLRQRIGLLKTVEEQLGLFESVKNSAGIVNRVTMLYSIAKITERDGKQKQVLEQERNAAQQGQSSAYVELLGSINRDISRCQPRSLSNVMWALGKVEEKDHKLVQVCEKEILSRDIATFNSADICQIVNGCTNLNLTTLNIFQNFEEVILNGQLRISLFDNQLLSAMLLSFAKTENVSVELFEVFLDEILSRDFLKIDNRALAEFVWSFAKKEFITDKLFDRVEEEILRRGTTDFHNVDLIKMLWGFATADKGSKQLFYFMDNELLSRGVEIFDNAELLEIVWSFAKRDMNKAKVFDLVKKEVFNRSVDKFQTHELVLILWSFVSAQRHNDTFVAEIEGELCSRDIEQFNNGLLRQVAWSLGRAGKSDSKMFDEIEAEVFQRGECQFACLQKFMLMRGFIEAKRGSQEFYKLLVQSFSPDDFCNLDRRQIYECVWCLSEAGVEAGTLFEALEKEVLINHGHYNFSQKELASIKKSFQKVGKGSSELFGL